MYKADFKKSLSVFAGIVSLRTLRKDTSINRIAFLKGYLINFTFSQQFSALGCFQAN